MESFEVVQTATTHRNQAQRRRHCSGIGTVTPWESILLEVSNLQKRVWNTEKLDNSVYTAGKDSELVTPTVLYMLTACNQHSAEGPFKGPGNTKDLGSTFFSTPSGSSPEERKERTNLGLLGSIPFLFLDKSLPCQRLHAKFFFKKLRNKTKQQNPFLSAPVLAIPHAASKNVTF